MSHIHDKIDFTATVMIVNGDAVLLRMHDKLGIWLGPGGHIELDEDPNQAILREVKEEVGLDVELVSAVPIIQPEDGTQELVPPRFINRHHFNSTHEHVDLLYFARAKSRAVIQGQDEVSPSCRWFRKEELENPELEIKDNVRHHALAALAELGSAMV